MEVDFGAGGTERVYYHWNKQTVSTLIRLRVANMHMIFLSSFGHRVLSIHANKTAYDHNDISFIVLMDGK